MKRILAAAVMAAVSLGASAQLSFSGGSNISFTNYNPSGLTAPQTQGRLNALISSSVAGTLSATFLGKEALDIDSYTFAMASGMLLNTSAIGSSITAPASIGALSFTFTDTFTGTSVGNGGSMGPFTSYVVIGSFTDAGVFVPYTGPAGQYQLVLGFNDGLTVDADYDDAVIGLNVTAVPEPESYALLLAGIGAVGFISRRRKQATA
jgi:PEP-CTERM motif